MATAIKSEVVFQSSTTNAAAGTTTGGTIDLTTALGCEVYGKITNGATGPTVACDFIIEISTDNGSTWRERNRATSKLGNNEVSQFTVRLPKEVMYARVKFTGNTAQDVTVEADGAKVTSIG